MLPRLPHSCGHCLQQCAAQPDPCLTLIYVDTGFLPAFGPGCIANLDVPPSHMHHKHSYCYLANYLLWHPLHQSLRYANLGLKKVII
jgi:hypothetical protein